MDLKRLPARIVGRKNRRQRRTDIRGAGALPPVSAGAGVAVGPDIEQPLKERFQRDLDIDPARALFMARLFDARHYRRVSGLESRDVDVLARHYIDAGIENDLSPSAYFDPRHVAECLGLTDAATGTDSASDEASPTPAMLAWLEHGFDRLPGTAWFDEVFYRSTYPDIDDSVANAYVHFVSSRHREERLPNPVVKSLCDTMLLQHPRSRARVHDIIASAPAGHLDTFLSKDGQSHLRSLFMATFYRTSFEDESTLAEESLFAHYLTRGWREHRRPSILFHERWYRSECSRHDIEPIEERNPWLHWLYIGLEHGIVPTPLFDTNHYTDVHADVRTRYSGQPFEHYLNAGVNEAGRSASVYFNPEHYRRVARPLEHPSPLIDYFLRGQALGLSPVEGLDVSRFATEEPWISNPAEEAAIYLRDRLHRLESGELAEQIKAVQTLEPQIVRPYGPRRVRMPPLLHPEGDLVISARAMAATLPKTHYKSVILIPHCRMAGSAKVSGALTRALANVTAEEDVLLITTDLTVFERSDWFPEGVDLFDFSAHHADLSADLRIRALLDLVRGLRPERLVTINSNLGWQLCKQYGRQLSEWMATYFYLFCWDLDFKGNKGGYPIQWFQPVFDHASAVFTDDASLRDELIERYAPSKALAERIVTLYEPAADTHVDYRDALMQRARHAGRRRVFWCGRFDRQKRLDLLVAIAAEMPDVEFHVWGKRVMTDDRDHLKDAPENLRTMGTYTAIDDIPIASCDAFLYTSAWDGMPSVLIEMSTRNIPIVASRVGGVGELITDNTGWPIEDIEDIDAYVDALREALENPTLAIDKATRLRRHTLDLCTHERYENTLREVLDREAARGASHVDIYDRELLEETPHVPADEHRHDITAVLTAHGEGSLAAVSYRNLEATCREAEEAGLKVERIVMLDRASPVTERVFEDLPATVRRIDTDFGDQGAVRNLAALRASGKYLAFIDGDDLWSPNWLVRAHRFLEATNEDVIAHPEFCRFFSGTSSIFINLDQDDEEFRLDFLRHANYWDAMGMASRRIHLEHPYCKRRIREGFAFEDWHWNCETIAAGLKHRVVADTIHFKRRRETSQTMQASANRSQMPLTALTDYSIRAFDPRQPELARADQIATPHAESDRISRRAA